MKENLEGLPRKRAVRHQTSEWTRVTLRVDPINKSYLGVSFSLLLPLPGDSHSNVMQK